MAKSREYENDLISRVSKIESLVKDIKAIIRVPINPQGSVKFQNSEGGDLLPEELLRECIREGMEVVLAKRKADIHSLLPEPPDLSVAPTGSSC